MDLEGLDKRFALRRTYQHRTRETIETTIIEEVVEKIIPNTKGLPAPTCPLCNDAGYLRLDVHPGHPQFGKPVRCSCKEASLKTQKQERLIRESGVLGLGSYRNATFESFNRRALGTRDAFVACRDFSVEPYGWLVLVGPAGCGKTHLAVATAKVRIAAGDTVLVQTVPDLLDELRAAFSPQVEETFNERFQEMRSVDVLFLDDYGVENTTPWATEKLFQILNFRYNADLPTIITSNSLADIDFRIHSRLSDGEKVITIDMVDAIDYRPSKKR